MRYIIVQQPNGRLAAYKSPDGVFVLINRTREQIAEYAKKEGGDLQRSLLSALDRYRKHTKNPEITWVDASAEHARNGGECLHGCCVITTIVDPEKIRSALSKIGAVNKTKQVIADFDPVKLRRAAALADAAEASKKRKAKAVHLRQAADDVGRRTIVSAVRRGCSGFSHPVFMNNDR